MGSICIVYGYLSVESRWRQILVGGRGKAVTESRGHAHLLVKSNTCPPSLTGQKTDLSCPEMTWA